MPAEKMEETKTEEEKEQRKVVDYDTFLKIKADAERREELLREAQAKLAQIKEEQDAEKAKALEEQGKFKELAEARAAELERAKTELEQKNAILEQIKKEQEEQVKKKLEALPEDIKKQLTPKLEKIADAKDQLDIIDLFTAANSSDKAIPGRATPGQDRNNSINDNLKKAKESGDIARILSALRK